MHLLCGSGLRHGISTFLQPRWMPVLLIAWVWNFFCVGAEPGPAKPGKPVAKATFDNGKLPPTWSLVRGELAAFNPEPGKPDNAVITNTGNRSVQIRIPVELTDFRIEWRVYARPGGLKRPPVISQMKIASPDWLMYANCNGLAMRLGSIEDLKTGQEAKGGVAISGNVDNIEGEGEDGDIGNDGEGFGVWHTYAIEKIGRTVILEVDGAPSHAEAILPASALEKPVNELFLNISPDTLVDDVGLYDLAERVAEMPGGMRVGYYPSLNKLVSTIYANRKQVRDARLRIVDAQEKVVWEKAVPVQFGGMIAPRMWTPDIQILDVPALPDGRYEVRGEIASSKGNWQPVGKYPILRKKFEWEGNQIGITNEVLPPFKPIEADGQDVKVVLRQYRLTGLGLIEQVEARGQDDNEGFKPLMAGPARLYIGEKPLEGQGKFVSKAPNKVVYEGQALDPAVRARVRNIIEEDGCMRIELTLEPGDGKTTLDRMHLDIPMRDDMTPLWHLGTRHLRMNPAGSTPAGDGVIWDSAKNAKGNEYETPFRPYLWFGDHVRGLSWFADNDRGWVLNLNDPPPCQELIRKDGVLILRVNLVQQPLTLSERRTIVFGLMATPAKPMPANWRAIGRRDGERILFSMPTLFGIPSAYGGRYPFNHDYSIMDQVHQNRAKDSKPLKREECAKIADEWVQRNVANRPEAVDGWRDSFRSRVEGGLGRFAGSGSRGLVTVYFDEFHGTSLLHEEASIYNAEWDANGPWGPAYGSRRFQILYGQPGKDWMTHPRWSWQWRIRSEKLPQSYQDFACWYGAQWLRRGMGLYFDNTFPRYVLDPLVSDAYFLPNGRIQPAAGIWSHRAYLRRIWTMHQQLRQPETPQIMMLHMTNTHIAPYMVWNEANLDLEWQMRRQEMFQGKFSPELLRAESLGLQTGNIPVAIGTISGGSVSEEWLADNKNIYSRALVLGFLVHEIKPGITTAYYPKVVDDFGYGLKDCSVVNYWDENPLLQVSDDLCKWLLLQRNGKSMLVLCTWNKADSDVQVRIDPALLGHGVTGPVDAETNEALKVQDNTINVPVTGYGGRIIQLN